MTAQVQSAPLSNLQLELLKVYSSGISEADLLEIRRMLARFFMEKAVQEATQIWEEKGYSQTGLLAEPS